jgi:hypothetical protein
MRLGADLRAGAYEQAQPSDKRPQDAKKRRLDAGASAVCRAVQPPDETFGCWS